DVARGDRTNYCAHGERGEDGGEGEGRARRPPRRQPLDLLAEGEAGAAQDDPHRGQRDRYVEGREDGAEGGREGGPEDDEDEDQPDGVALPDRGQRALDQRPWPLPLLGVPRDQVPEPAAEVGAAEERVEG